MDLFKQESEYTDHTDQYDELDAKYREERGEFKGMYTIGEEEAWKTSINLPVTDDGWATEVNNFRGQSGNNKMMMDDINAFMRSKGMKLGGPAISGPDPDNPASAFPNMKQPEEWAQRVVGPQQRKYMRQFLEPGKSPWMPVNPDYSGDDYYYDMPSLQALEEARRADGIEETDRQMLFNQSEMNRDRLARMQERIAEDMRNNPLQINIINDGNWYRKVDEWLKAGEDYVERTEKESGIHQGAGRVVMGLSRMFVGEPLRALREIQEADFSRTPSDMPDDGKGLRAVIETATNTGILSTVAPAPVGALRLFGGVGTAERIAKSGADHLANKPLEAIRKAEQLEAQGMKESQIRAEINKDLSATPFGGVSKDDSGKWVMEFDDSKMVFTSKGKDLWQKTPVGQTLGIRLSDLIDMKYMKEMGLNNVYVDFKKNNAFMGTYGKYTGTPNGHILIEARNLEEAKGLLKHEMQHRLQHVDNMERGASPESPSLNPVVAKMVDRRGDLRDDMQFARAQHEELYQKAIDDMKARGVKPGYQMYDDQGKIKDVYTKDQIAQEKHWGKKIEESHLNWLKAKQLYEKEFPGDKSYEWTAYHRMAGEAQARNVDKRGEMTAAERRAINPESTADVARHLRFRWEDVGGRPVGTPAHVDAGRKPDEPRYDYHKNLRNRITSKVQSAGILEKNIDYYKGIDLHNRTPSEQKRIKDQLSIFEGRLIKRRRDIDQLVKQWEKETGGLPLPRNLKHLEPLQTKGPEQGVPKTLGSRDVWVGNKLHDDIDMD